MNGKIIKIAENLKNGILKEKQVEIVFTCLSNEINSYCSQSSILASSIRDSTSDSLESSSKSTDDPI